ncbi:DEAD/DEAH box helicase [Thalassobacillus sp. C254]|uniref:DEAD/DEAH box helicase n=1 Tax=Thalassobacillus sp. C254 TaxID=1225341 RepID=UPI000B1DE316|nr:DEAD/DEAH box helicase [Thalassobacillus sp. C254]
MDDKQSITWPLLEKTSPFIQNAWKEAGFNAPTKVQERAVPSLLEGQNMVVEAPTGTGKTIAYLIPLLQKIDPEMKNTQAVIIAPSRELVMQVLEELNQWTKGSGIEGAAFIGGANIKRQIDKLKKTVHVAVGTPGRVLELIELKKLKMHKVSTLVLDEGDQLITQEHEKSLQKIRKASLKDTQILFTSATISTGTAKKAKELLGEAEELRISKGKEEVEKVNHIYFVCEQREKIDILRRYIRTENIRALTFVNNVEQLTEMSDKLAYRGVSTEALHGDSNKDERKNAITRFRNGETTLLLATDVAARGLDIKELSHVIQLDLPRNADQYSHRAGRTGRAGASGTVVSLVTKREEQDLKKISSRLKIKVVRKKLYKGNIVDE